MALVRISRRLGLEPELTRVNRLTEPFDLAQFDLALLGSGELAVMPEIIDALTLKLDDFSAFVAAGKGLLVTGNSGGLVAQSTSRLDGRQLKGLGLLDMTVEERTDIYGDDLTIEVDGLELSGIQIRQTDCRLGPAQAAFGEVVYGLGNSADQIDEGARHQNLIFSHLLGPMLVKNPWFTAHYIKTVMTTQQPDLELSWPTSQTWEFERLAAQAIDQFNDDKTIPEGVLRQAKLSLPPADD